MEAARGWGRTTKLAMRMSTTKPQGEGTQERAHAAVPARLLRCSSVRWCHHLRPPSIKRQGLLPLTRVPVETTFNGGPLTADLTFGGKTTTKVRGEVWASRRKFMQRTRGQRFAAVVLQAIRRRQHLSSRPSAAARRATRPWNALMRELTKAASATAGGRPPMPGSDGSQAGTGLGHDASHARMASRDSRRNTATNNADCIVTCGGHPKNQFFIVLETEDSAARDIFGVSALRIRLSPSWIEREAMVNILCCFQVVW